GLSTPFKVWNDQRTQTLRTVCQHRNLLKHVEFGGSDTLGDSFLCGLHSLCLVLPPRTILEENLKETIRKRAGCLPASISRMNHIHPCLLKVLGDGPHINNGVQFLWATYDAAVICGAAAANVSGGVSAVLTSLLQNDKTGTSGYAQIRMLPFKRTFDSEKQQLQELNSRLAQYLSRTKQLEQENAHLIAEINKLKRGSGTAEWEQRYKADMKDLRRKVGQISFEKSQAEMEREKLWRELQTARSLCSEQTEACRDISGELKGCEQELQQAHKINSDLQQRLLQLESEYKRLEDAHRHETAELRHQVESRVVPIITQTYHGPPVVSVEEVQEYARGLSEGWIETIEMYQKNVEEMEQSIKADQARLCDLQKEKMMYASELGKLRTEAEKQAQVQMRLEEELLHMQDKFRVDLSEHQIIIEQLEHERNILAEAMEEKMREHQHLLQVKMDLGMEVAAYRTLLESERVGMQGVHRRMTQHQRERIIGIVSIKYQGACPTLLSKNFNLNLKKTYRYAVCITNKPEKTTCDLFWVHKSLQGNSHFSCRKGSASESSIQKGYDLVQQSSGCRFCAYYQYRNWPG
ncbi:hypothetical protein CCH79_00012247, partial [Gambusia affinis]